MTTYSIDDGHGQQITTGLQGYDHARQVARRLATKRGESVYLYADEDPDSQCSAHGCSRWECDDSHDGPEEIVPAETPPSGSQPKTSPGILAILEGR